jgi:hypothetical protein
MRNSYGRIAVLGPAVCALLALAYASPAAAQFGGLKKKAQSAAGQEAAKEAEKKAGVSAPTNAGAPAAPAAQQATGPAGGSVVLTPDVVDKMLAGLKATDAYRKDAYYGDTPYGRYNKAREAYEAAQAKCQAGHQAFINRMASDEKLANQYSELMNKMSEAMAKGDRETAMNYNYQALALQDPSCAVREPTRPDDYMQQEQDLEAKAEQAGVKGSGLSESEYAMARERGWGILNNSPPPDVSESEKSAVKAKESELKPLMGFHDMAAERAKKTAPAPTPAPTPPPPPPAATVPPGATAMNECMAKNAQKHEEELEALGERAKAAQEAGDMTKTMAIADTIRQLQMAGCSTGQ